VARGWNLIIAASRTATAKASANGRNHLMGAILAPAFRLATSLIGFEYICVPGFYSLVNVLIDLFETKRIKNIRFSLELIGELGGA
jgi:hypothetical protein